MNKTMQKAAPNLAQQLPTYRTHLLALALPSGTIDVKEDAVDLTGERLSKKPKLLENPELCDAFRDWLQWEKVLATQKQNDGRDSNEMLRWDAKCYVDCAD